MTFGFWADSEAGSGIAEAGFGIGEGGSFGFWADPEGGSFGFWADPEAGSDLADNLICSKSGEAVAAGGLASAGEFEVSDDEAAGLGAFWQHMSAT